MINSCMKALTHRLSELKQGLKESKFFRPDSYPKTVLGANVVDG